MLKVAASACLPDSPVTRKLEGRYTLAAGGSNRLLSLTHAAELLDVPVRRLRDNWKAWGIPAFRIGRELRIRERDLWAYVEAQRAV